MKQVLKLRRSRSEPVVDLRPHPPAGARHLMVVVLDSLRYDSWQASSLPSLGRLGPVQRRFSYATWTAPSHFNLMLGLLPHSSPSGALAHQQYQAELQQYERRLAIPNLDLARLLPGLWLPAFLRGELGYRTHAYVSMPVLNPATPLNRDFDSYSLMPTHNDMSAMLELLRFDQGPSFHLLNVGETHYPYATPGEDCSAWPRLHGLYGTVRDLGKAPAVAEVPEFDSRLLSQMHDRQIAALGYLDGVFDRLFHLLPDDTWLVVTSDHGELFGEDGYFGHGPITHPLVQEVPFVEGLVPR
ncbi:MAG: sulfatase-like hydrolase/transferase [Mycobacteriales bacterium]